MRIAIIILFLFGISNSYAQTIGDKPEVKELNEKIKKIESENQTLQNNYNNLAIQYQHTNDRLNNYLTYTAIIAAIFGVLMALAGIYIGFEGLRSQRRTNSAIKTLEEARDYVNSKKSEFDSLIEGKKLILKQEYEKLTELIKEKLLDDIEIETSKVREIAEKKSEEIQKFSVKDHHNATIEVLEKKLNFLENIGIPDDPEILFSKAKLLREKKMHAEAILLLEKLVQKVPEHKQAFWHLGYEYAEIADYDQSIRNYKKHLEYDSDDPSALNNLGVSYMRKNAFLDALECYGKAIELSDKTELYYTNRIDVLTKLNSNEKIIENYVKLLTINSENEKYYYEIIKFLGLEKRDSDVIIYYDKAIDQFGSRSSDTANKFNFSKAVYLGESGKEQAALVILQTLIDRNYKIDSCYVKIAELKDKLGKTDEAIKILDNGIASNPLSSALYIYKAFMQANTNEAESKATIDFGGQLINQESFYYIGGRFFFKNNKLDLANYCYEKALELIRHTLLEKTEEGDFVNFYETLIILQRPLEEFNSNYRKFIKSEKYLVVLSVLDIVYNLSINFNDEEKRKALFQIKACNIEAKDKDLIKWNFDDIYWFIDKRKGSELSTFVSKLIKYVKKDIRYEDI